MHGDYNPSEFMNDHQYAYLNLSLTHDFLACKYVMSVFFNRVSLFIGASVGVNAICVYKFLYIIFRFSLQEVF